MRNEQRQRTALKRDIVVKGTLLTAIAQGATAGVAYYLLGVPFSVFLGALSGLLSLLPVGGTAIVWVPVAFYLLLSGAVAQGVILIGVGAVLVGLMDNLLQPLLVGGHARLRELGEFPVVGRTVPCDHLG